MFLAMVLGAASLSLDSLIPLIIAIIVICIVIYAISILLGMIALPPPVKQLVWLLVAVVVLIVILNFLGLAH